MTASVANRPGVLRVVVVRAVMAKRYAAARSEAITCAHLQARRLADTGIRSLRPQMDAKASHLERKGDMDMTGDVLGNRSGVLYGSSETGGPFLGAGRTDDGTKITTMPHTAPFAPVGSSARAGRVVLYSHDTFGLGHLRRSRALGPFR